MADDRTVKQGEHLVQIASECGFSDYHTIWDHPNNARLTKERENPNVLFPGDVLFIPDKQAKTYPAQTSLRHRFVLHSRELRIQVRFEHAYRGAIANTERDFVVGTNSSKLTTDRNGSIECPIARALPVRRLVAFFQSNFHRDPTAQGDRQVTFELFGSKGESGFDGNNTKGFDPMCTLSICVE
jgi:hypothetical protein